MVFRSSVATLITHTRFLGSTSYFSSYKSLAAGVKVIENFVARFYLSNAGVTQLNLRAKSLQTQNIQREYLNRSNKSNTISLSPVDILVCLEL